MSRPRVFVSSTCYDLKHLREGLRALLETFGCEPILSEYPSFPVDPTATTAANCRRNVRETADIMLLIVGSRYGSVLNSGKSITNAEFDEAERKGIPVYVFVQEDMLSVLRIYKDNPDGNFAGVVDNVQVLEFAQNLYERRGKWVFGFSSASDVEDHLRTQFGELIRLGATDLFRRRNSPAQFLATLRGPAYEAAADGGPYWEARYLLARMDQELVQHRRRRVLVERGLELAPSAPRANRSDLLDKTSAISDDVRRLTRRINYVVTEVHPESQGDVMAVEDIVMQLTESYRFGLELASSCNSTRIKDPGYEEDWRELTSLCKKSCLEVVDNIETFLSSVRAAIAEPGDDDDAARTVVFEFTNHSIHELSEYADEFFGRF